ncbi:MAG: threonine--tRNA ligase [Candidatus Veblenbacteria bacterium]|nr:threonine--tRNA ligase [Candidatus Veblenbacteria bacterium]
MPSSLEAKKHSLAHLLAAAVQELYPEAKRTIGPAIEDGFYYDFDFGQDKVSVDDLQRIEDKMRETLPSWSGFEREERSVAETKEMFKDNPYKLELIAEFAQEGQRLSTYTSGPPTGGFTDLCRGGHAESMKEIKTDSWKLDRLAGAYWRGDEKNKMLTRIYGLAFETKKELAEYLSQREEAAKRDHRKLGKELKLFTFSDYVGPGMPLWLPNGAVITEELEKLAKETEFKAGYKIIRTPHIAKESMYKTSGHLPYYADTMFPPMVMDEDGNQTTYYLKAMNCPHHHQVYAAEPRSYRDLPLRLAEYGTVYRYEKSGELFGLMRVRMLSMNDAHIYLTAEQFAEEFKAVNDMYLNYFKLFGISKYVMQLSTHSPEGLGKKYVNEPQLWQETEDLVRRTMQESGVNFTEVADEAAFYGPKIDVQVWSSIGREFAIATNQVDFAQPKRFGLTYVDKGGANKTPLCIHRAPLGTHERFIGFLIEHYGGAFPTWLAPVQVKLLPVGVDHVNYCEKLATELRNKMIRVEMDDANETIGNKIRKAEKEKIPYALVVGEKEISSGNLAVRKRSVKEISSIPNSQFIADLEQEISERRS